MGLKLLLPAAAAVLLLAAGCATLPADPGPPPETVVDAAIADANPYHAIEVLTGLLARTGLAPEQRAEALYHRASIRRQAGDDRRGAIADFEEMLALAPEHPLASRARTELDFTRKDIAAIEASHDRLLTLSQWFDGMWALGEHDVAAARIQRSGLAPNQGQAEKLLAAGYVCPDDDPESRLHVYGEPHEYLIGLKWCSDLGN